MSKKLAKLSAVFTSQPGAVLIYSNPDVEPMLIDVSTREKMDVGLKWLFQHLDTYLGVYGDLLYAPGDDHFQSEMAELRAAIAKAESKSVALALQARLSDVEAEHRKACHGGLGRKRALYAKAKEGDVKAIAELLKARRTYEHESWRILVAVNPLEGVEADDVDAPTGTADDNIPTKVVEAIVEHFKPAAEAGAPPETRQEKD